MRGEKKYCVAIKADKTNHFPVWVVSYYVWTWGELEWGDCCWWEERVWMPGAAESSLCISEKCCYEWSHAYSALVHVMTEWGVTKWSVTVFTHNSMHLPIFTLWDPGPSRGEHNKIKHIQGARHTCWGSSVMQRSAGAKTTVMDVHLHESCSFPPCVFIWADWSCAKLKKYFSIRMSLGSEEVVGQVPPGWLMGPIKRINFKFLQCNSYRYHLWLTCAVTLLI